MASGDDTERAMKKTKATKQRPAQAQSRQPGRQDEMRPEPVTIRAGYRGGGRLDGRRAFITGGDSGIGRAVAVHFAREGADVAIAYREEDAQALAARGIRVNCVAPGPVWTPLIPASFDADKVATFGSDTLLGRAGQPAEIAPMYVFLACEEASFVTGQVMHVNGGSFLGG